MCVSMRETKNRKTGRGQVRESERVCVTENERDIVFISRYANSYDL